ncbi:hypothetical protein T492DRAFT_912871 [Pavlovales sp. CCMP2436]|nr:hypothetical protein T492DRAFT_912871 [Pavlovales sp. CCMP2436]
MPLKATKATTTMLLPAATAVCALAAARCCPLETPLKATKATTTMLLPAAAAGAAARGGGPHTETPLKATKATKMMLLPAAATAGLRRPRRGQGAQKCGEGRGGFERPGGVGRSRGGLGGARWRPEGPVKTETRGLRYRHIFASGYGE